MKNTPTSIINGLTADVAKPYFLLEMGFTSGAVRLTSLPYDVTVGGNVYSSDGGLTELSPPQLTSVLDREVYRIKLVDYDHTYKDIFEAGCTGTPATVSLGIVGNTSDFDILYKGVIDAVFIQTDFEEGTKDAVIEFSSPFGALERTKDRRCNKETQAFFNATDTCFNRVFNGADEISLKWGKK